MIQKCKTCKKWFPYKDSFTKGRCKKCYDRIFRRQWKKTAGGVRWMLKKKLTALERTARTRKKILDRTLTKISELKMALKINEEIKGRETRYCEYPGCKWHDSHKGKLRYGCFWKGKYYCPEHEKLVCDVNKVLDKSEVLD